MIFIHPWHPRMSTSPSLRGPVFEFSSKDYNRPVQPLARRLAETASARRPWPAGPVPVALVITELDVGGAEKALVALATGLDRRRWRPAVVALGPEAPLAAPLRAAGVECTCLAVDA